MNPETLCSLVGFYSSMPPPTLWFLWSKCEKFLHLSNICAIMSFAFKRWPVASRQSILYPLLTGTKGRCSVDYTKLILSIFNVAACLFLISVVLLQSGKSTGLSGAIAGVADTFMSKNKAKSWDAKLAKMTKWVAIGFICLTFVNCLL